MIDAALGRRMALRLGLGMGLAGATAATAACQVTDVAGSSADEKADLALAGSAARELAAAIALINQTRRHFPVLNGPLRDLSRAHRDQLAALDVVAVGQPRPRVTASRAGAALAAVRANEERVQRRMRTAAVAAIQPELAVLFASISTGIAQHLSALPQHADTRHADSGETG